MSLLIGVTFIGLILGALPGLSPTTMAVALLIPYKAPHKIYLMKELPKGPSGKIHRLKVAKLFADRLKSSEG